MKTSEEIRKAFLEFWQSKERNHKEIPNVSLVPNVDSTLLFVNSGMFPLAPYLGGEDHPQGKRLCNIQRCLRTKYDEMIEVGDNRHTLMFEMMGNWSLGDYFKAEQIPWVLELHVEHYGLDPNKLYASVWGGNEQVPRDDEAIEAWKKAFRKYGIEAEFSEDITQIPDSVADSEGFKYRIFPYGAGDNWWKRGDAPGELGGPSSELFYDTGNIEREQDEYHINDDSGRFLEIGNSVFMQFKYDDQINWQPLSQKNIDFGGGFERVVMCVQEKNDIFETDIYQSILDKISEISGKPYKTDGELNEYTAAFRVIADHGRAATFILGDGVKPSNKDQGYILRRFIRRFVRFGMKLEIENNFAREVTEAVIERMGGIYPNLTENKEWILNSIEKEEKVFRQTLRKGLKELEKIKVDGIDGEKAFYIYETYGFPLELTLDELEVDEEKADEITTDFKKAEKAHREKSRAGAEKKFKGGLADQSIETTKLHTAHHLLLKALQIVLGDHVKQRGSNITAERLRIDFSNPEKLTPEQVEKVEEIVNEKINQGLNVIKVEMPKSEAESIGAEMEFGQKYPDNVNVYFITEEDTSIAPSEYFSAEFCGGPHVANTSEIGDGGKRFKIYKQENVGAGIKRIKARLE